ncbi:unnamed protein product, partial [Pleuronectes platessa]
VLAGPLLLYPLISAFLHFGVSLCHPSMVTSRLSLLLGLQILSLPLSLITCFVTLRARVLQTS